MKNYQAPDIRNFVIAGHASAGKTMLGEAMLACAGVITRMGSIAAGTTASDYSPGEKKRQISIHATLLNAEWMERKFNIIDAPGYADFMSEGLGALRVGDFALIVVHGNHGIELGTIKVWDYATKYQIPKVLTVTACDREDARFDDVLEQARARFGSHVFPMSLPINAGPGFNQVLDVLRSEIITYQTDGSGKLSEEPAAGEWKDKVNALHKELIELIAESDDSLLEKFFDKGGLSEEEMRAGIHAAVQKEGLIPLFAVSGETNVGVARLMDFIAKYGSSPVDRKKVPAIDANGKPVEVSLSDASPVLYVFKTLAEAHVGELSFFRLYAGSVHTGMDLFNSDRKINERIGQMFFTNGKDRVSAGTINAGDIGAMVKLRDTHTDNTLCSVDNPVTLPKVEHPAPNIHAALKYNSKTDEDKIAKGLAQLHEEDVTFHYRVDPELHQTIISGQGELHLQVICDRLKRRFNVDVELIEPLVPYRETIKGRGESKYRHKKQTGGAGQFAEVWMKIEPGERDSGIDFSESLTGQNVDRSFVPSVEKGVRAACEEGVLAGYRVVDVKIDFYDGKMHPVDSKDVAFQIAGRSAFREAFQGAQPRLLEPIYDVEIQVPEDRMGAVLGDLSSRRGRVQTMEGSDGFQVIKAQVPQKELYHYSSQLRSLTAGRGAHTESFSHYEEMPRELEQRVIADSAHRRQNGD
ncbi:elongation factor G [bacterium]|nr:elongation factor G [bacterium]